MLTLTPNECRVLGVLIEKAQTTPQQYPLTLNALTNGANQKNNREPVTNLSEEQVLEALDGLRNKGLAREVMLTGSRVQKYRHVAREVLNVSTSELVILAELLLRGPQTLGELRGRASRMHPLESLDIVKNVLDSLMGKTIGESESGGVREPMVRELPPAPGDRSPRFGQLLCPELHPVDAPALTAAATGSPRAQPIDFASTRTQDELIARVEKLEAEMHELRNTLARINVALGEPSAVNTRD